MAHPIEKFATSLFLRVNSVVHRKANLKALREKYNATDEKVFCAIIFDWVKVDTGRISATGKPVYNYDKNYIYSKKFRVTDDGIELMSNDTQEDAAIETDRHTFIQLVDGKIVRHYPHGDVIEPYTPWNAMREDRVDIKIIRGSGNFLADWQLFAELYNELFADVRQTMTPT